MDLESEIKTLYIEEQLPIRAVAERLNISTSTLRRRMKSFGIKSRDKNHGRNDWWQTEEFLSNSYLIEMKSTVMIAEEVGSTPSTVVVWLKHFNIDRREKGGSLRGQKMSLASREKMSVAKKGKNTGESNPNWKGNLVSDDVRERRSYIAKKWRQVILDRDSYKCQKCGCSEKLHVHHIKEFKDYPELRWDINNGITVCVSCHEKIHSRRFPDWLTGRITHEQDIVQIKSRVEFKIAKQHLEKLYETHSMKEIGEMFGVSDEVVRNRIHKLGIHTRLSGGMRRFHITKEQLQSLYNQHSMKEIADMLNVGQTTIHKRIHEYNIKKSTG